VRERADPVRPEEVNVLATDVLIIGGGIAGMYAALKAKATGANVLLVSKGPIGRSGGSVFAGTLVAYMDPTWLGYERVPNPDEKLTHLDKYYYLMDGPHLVRSGEFIRNHLLGELEEMGLYFLRLPDGRVIHNPTKPKHTWTPKMGMSGRAIGDLLRRHVLDAGIPVIEEAMATSLIATDGVCGGATVLNFVTGDFFAVHAKNTILATGHANYLSARSTGTREVCGDGIALPYRAGAELFNLEMQEWHVTDMAWPRAWTRLHIYPNPLPVTRETARLVADDRVLFEQRTIPRINKPYHYQHKRLYQHAVASGKHYEDYKWGGYFSDLRHVDGFIQDAYSYQTQFPRKLGIDPTTQLVENAPSYHYIVGGVWVDFPTMGSRTVERLYAVGGAAGRDGQTDCMFDAHVAIASIRDRQGDQELPDLDVRRVHEERDRVCRLIESAGEDGIGPMEVKNQIRDVMWRGMDYVKTEPKMRQAHDELEEIREAIVPRMRVQTRTRRYNTEWVDALDVFNMLDACQLQIRASIERQESRGPFFREDFPYQDNENWQRYVIVGKSDSSVAVRHEPIVIDGLSLPAREDFLVQ
jgi:succinate dehydrogenase/fumarate reductase flavoprotein subunit